MDRSRRTFLKQVSTAAALAPLANLPIARLRAATPAELMPEADEALLRQLALTAIDAARGAGATFADVRVTGGRCIAQQFTASYRSGKPEMSQPFLDFRTEYGIRTIVDGAWGFAGGSEPTPDAMRAVALRAVSRARGNKPRRPRTIELAPVPPAQQGRWSTPIAIDPFAIPIGQQVDLGFAALEEGGRVKGLDYLMVGWFWSSNINVFASTEGALIVQHRATGAPAATANVFPTETAAGVAEAAQLPTGPYGYESLSTILADVRRVGERAVEESKRPQLPLIDTEVGRFDVVLGTETIAGLIVSTLVEALNLPRALGYEANGTGTSFAAPPMDMLGKYKLSSPLLTLRADRTRPRGPATIGWDDEGVSAGETTLVQDGVIVDYLSTRQTAVELGDWYRSRGQQVRAQGFTGGAGERVPEIELPNLSMVPGKDEASVEDLIADTKRGYYLKSGGGIPDQQLLNTQGYAGEDSVWQIRNGKLVARVRDFGFQFITPSLWKTVDAIGGPKSKVVTLQGTQFANVIEPLQTKYAHVDVVPARVRQVNILNYGQML